MNSKFEAACEIERKLKSFLKRVQETKINVKKEKRRSSKELNELQEGDMYASGTELRNDKELKDEIIPTYIPCHPMTDEWIKQ